MHRTDKRNKQNPKDITERPLMCVNLVWIKVIKKSGTVSPTNQFAPFELLMFISGYLFIKVLDLYAA